jgi:hypothetical protein
MARLQKDGCCVPCLARGSKLLLPQKMLWPSDLENGNQHESLPTNCKNSENTGIKKFKFNAYNGLSISKY